MGLLSIGALLGGTTGSQAAVQQYLYPSPACSDCHGMPPLDAAYRNITTGAFRGNHQTHNPAAATAANCEKCHTGASGYTTSATGHSDGLISMATAGNINGSGAYAKPVFFNQTSSPTPASCSSVNCHFETISPVWGSASFGQPYSSSCGSCHEALPTSNSHTKHLVQYGNDLTVCARCHTDHSSEVKPFQHATSAGRDITVSSGSYAGSNFRYLPSQTGRTLGACSTASCHASPYGAGFTTSPVWGDNTQGCAACHNVSVAGAFTSNGAPATGSHPKHMALSGALCNQCHSGAISGTSGGATHANGSVEVSNGYTASPVAKHAIGTYTGSCATASCHSNGAGTLVPTPNWGAGMPADCTGCHGTKRTSLIATTLSGRHDRHLNYSTNTSLGRGNGFNCVDCHAKTASGNTTISTAANHGNGFIDYSGLRAGGSARYSTATKQCSNIYCHSNGNPNAPVFVSMTGSKVWNGAASLGCNGCHGRSNTATGAPDYNNGGAASSTANSHPRHVAGAGITDTRGCANCHAKTVDPSTAGRFKDYTAASYHLNRTPDLIFKNIGGKSGNWNGSTCSNTYCHGTVSAAWGTLTPLTCNSCHSADVTLPGAHKIHVTTAALASSYTNMSGNVSSTTSYRFSCAACHSPVKGATHAGGPADVNGPAQVFFGFTSASLKGGVYNYGAASAGTDPTGGFSYTAGGGNSGVCNNSYCHSNGQSGNGLATVSWNTTVSTGTCLQCHDTKQTGATVTGLSGKHDAHMNPTNSPSLGLGNGFNCIDCHARTVSANNTVSDKSRHVNKFIDYSGIRAGGSTRYSTTTKLCSSIYCHSNGNPNAIIASPRRIYRQAS